DILVFKKPLLQNTTALTSSIQTEQSIHHNQKNDDTESSCNSLPFGIATVLQQQTNPKSQLKKSFYSTQGQLISSQVQSVTRGETSTRSTPEIDNPWLPYYLSTISPMNMVTNWCAKCSVQFRMTSDLVNHIRMQHGRHKQENTTEGTNRKQGKLICQICFETFRERHHLTRHMTSHSQNFEIKCYLITSTIIPKVINTFEVRNPGFTSLFRTWNLNTTSWSFYISSFNAIPFTTDMVSYVPNIQYDLTISIVPTVITENIIWPNGIISADDRIFGKPYSIIVASGFLVPGKTNGNLYFIPPPFTTKPIPLVPIEAKSWFYHDATFRDMDLDGYVDIVTARAHVPIVGSAVGELIWLKNPGQNFSQNDWSINYIADGPDIHVKFTQLTVGERRYDVLFTHSYFNQKLQIYWSEEEHGSWNDSTKISKRDIDGDQGFFDITLTDLNGDSHVELLVPCNDVKNGSLVVYEIPTEDFRTGEFVKHVLASNFKPISQTKGRGAPGSALIVKMNNQHKPVIALSGDDDGCAYILEAQSEDVSDWNYTLTKFHQVESTVGQLSGEDIDNDGNPEIFVPSYGQGQMTIYRFLRE
ncbi:unnamed protein product, partial [Didymodactylos carnosus]